MKLLVSLMFLWNYANTLPDSIAKKHVDFVTCAILQKLQIVQNVQHFVPMESKNVWKFVQLANPDVCVPSLNYSKINIHMKLIGKWIWIIVHSVVSNPKNAKLGKLKLQVSQTQTSSLFTNIKLPESLRNPKHRRSIT